MFSKNFWKDSFSNLKKIPSLSLGGMLIAISCLLSFPKFAIGQNINITFMFLPISIAALVLGPVSAGLIGGCADILGCIIKPTGPYFPAFTLNAVIIGVIYGLIFYKKPVKLWRIILARLIVAVVVDIILTPIWLHILYSTPLVWALYVERLIKCAIVCPIEIILMFIINSTVSRLFSKK